MTEAHIKEELSIHLFSAIAARAGYSTIKPRIDNGDDLIVTRTFLLPHRRRPHAEWQVVNLSA